VTRQAIILCSGLFISGCATLEDAHLPAPPPFPTSIEAGLARVDAAPPCVTDQSYYVNPSANPSADRPIRVRSCVPAYLEELSRHGYEAACLSDFQLSSDGVPTNIRTNCNTVHDYGRNAQGVEIAKPMFERLMARVVGEMRYAPAGVDKPIDTEKVFVQPLKFADEGGAPYLRYPTQIEKESGE